MQVGRGKCVNSKPECPYCASPELILNEDGSGLCRDCGCSFLNYKETVAKTHYEGKPSGSKTFPGSLRGRPEKQKALSYYFMVIGGVGLIIMAFVIMYLTFVPLRIEINDPDMFAVIITGFYMTCLMFLIMFISGVIKQIDELQSEP